MQGVHHMDILVTLTAEVWSSVALMTPYDRVTITNGTSLEEKTTTIHSMQQYVQKSM